MAEESLKHRTKISLYWKFFEQAANYGMQFLIGIVMARLLSPSDFGTAALPAVFIAIAQVFIDSGFALALIRKPVVTEKDLSTSFYYSIIVGVVLYFILYVCAPYIAVFYETPILTPLIRVSALSFIWNPLLTPQTVILSRKLNFKTPARISIITRFLSGGLGIIVAYLGYGIWALVAASLSSSILGLLLTWVAVKWVPRKAFSAASFKYLWDFGNKMVVVGLLKTITGNIVPILLGKYGGTLQLGIYNRAVQFAALPSSNIAVVINNVTFPVLSKMQDNMQAFSDNYRKMIRVSSFIVFPVMLLMCALAKPMILFLVTDKWIECVVLLQIMCFTYMFQPAQILNVNLLQVLGRTDLSLKLEIIKKTLLPLMIFIAVQYNLIILCIADFIYTMIALFLNTYYTGKLIDVGYLKQLRDLIPSFILSLVMMTIVIGVVSFISTPILQLIVGGFVGFFIYIAGAYLLRFDELIEVKYLLNIRK